MDTLTIGDLTLQCFETNLTSSSALTTPRSGGIKVFFPNTQQWEGLLIRHWSEEHMNLTELNGAVLKRLVVSLRCGDDITPQQIVQFLTRHIDYGLNGLSDSWESDYDQAVTWTDIGA